MKNKKNIAEKETTIFIGKVWKNKGNNQRLISVPSASPIKEGEMVIVDKLNNLNLELNPKEKDDK